MHICTRWAKPMHSLTTPTSLGNQAWEVFESVLVRAALIVNFDAKMRVSLIIEPQTKIQHFEYSTWLAEYKTALMSRNFNGVCSFLINNPFQAR